MPTSHSNENAQFFDLNAPLEDDIHPKQLTLADIEKSIPQISDNYKSPLNQSIIEKSYSNRIIENLEQYGYDLFSAAKTNRDIQQAIPAGTVQDNFILSAGDELDIVMRGQINSRNQYKINSKGRLIIDNIAPITAAGKSLKTVRKELESSVSALHNTQIHASLSGVRQINVLVLGHVRATQDARASQLFTVSLMPCHKQVASKRLEL